MTQIRPAGLGRLSAGLIPKPGHLQMQAGFWVHPGFLTPLSSEGIHVPPAIERWCLSFGGISVPFFIFPTGEKAMGPLDFFTGRSADQLVQHELTLQDTITFGHRLFTIGGIVAIGLTVIALRYFA